MLSNTNFMDNFDAFVGTTSGIFKGIIFTKDSCIQKNLQNINSITKDDVVTRMSWGNEQETEILLGCGISKTKSYKIYDTQSNKFLTTRICNVGKGKIIGVSRYDENIITVAESGHIKLWTNKKDEKILTEAGENLHRMRHSGYEKNIIGTGGNENPLKLYDLQTGKEIFEAKNIKHDSLELRVPVSVKDIGFFPNNSQVVAVGKYGHVQLYDPNSQRRPVMNLEIKDESLTTLAVCPQEKQIIVGTGKGRMNLVDLRKPGKILNTYKGSVGGITSIALSKNNPNYIVSVGLDRFLRIYNIRTKKMIRKVYLKSRATNMLLNSEFSLKNEE